MSVKITLAIKLTEPSHAFVINNHEDQFIVPLVPGFFHPFSGNELWEEDSMMVAKIILDSLSEDGKKFMAEYISQLGVDK